MARVLVAEDDRSMRAVIVKALKAAGHEPREAPDGRAALGLVTREPFDVLLTDVAMPGLDGIELARRALERDPDLRVVFITGFAGVTLERLEGPLDGRPVISKPFHLRQIVDALARLEAA